MSAFRDILTRLFTRNVVIKRLPGNRLKTLDVNKSQSVGSPTTYSNRARWRNGRSFNSVSGYGSGFTNEEIEALRQQMYMDYELMDTDSIISSALDITSDECLGRNTIIPLLDGRRITIKELYENKESNFWLYGINNSGEFIPVQADKVIFKGRRQCLQLTFDDGTKVNCTPDHDWVVDKNLNLKKSKDLIIGDSIFALKWRLSSEKDQLKPGYAMIQVGNSGKFDYVHRIVSRNISIENFELKEIFKKPVIHHKSLNKINNSPDQLVWMDFREHTLLHCRLNNEIWERRRNNPEEFEKFKNNIGEKNRIRRKNWSDEYRKQYSEQCSIRMKKIVGSLTPEERKVKFGLCGEKNGRWKNGKSTSGSKNGRYYHGYDRIENINLVEAIQILLDGYKSITDNGYNLLQTKYNFPHREEYLKLTKLICNLFGISSIKQLNQKVLQLNSGEIISNLRKFLNEYPDASISKISKFVNLSPFKIKKILQTSGYNSFHDFKNSNNHRIIDIQWIEDDVYDIVNCGDNHLFAIEANDGSKLFTHNCTTVSIDGQLLVIKTDDAQLKKVLHNLFYDILNIEFNLWSWIRTTCKYGDSFLYLQIAEEFGVVNVMPIHPSLMIREEGTSENPDQIRFRYEGDAGFSYSPKSYFEQFEIAHFRLLTDTNFLPYGRSYIEPARKEYKRLLLMEDAMLINRIMRAPERRLFKIDIGNIAPDEVDAYMEQITQEMKKVPYIDPATGDFNLKFNLQNQLEDFYMPVRGGDSGTSIETLDGLENAGQKDDVEYFKNKMIAALKIPKEYLGYGDDGGAGGGKANLATVDIRFARTIERIQKIIVSELYKVAIVHLYVQGFKNEDLLNFELYLTNPSLVFERQKTDVLTAKVDLVKSIKEDNLFSDKYIYENIFGMTEDEWKAERDEIIESAKHKFRVTQITEEGNDPEVTGKSFGTPWDIATLQMAGKNGVGNSEDMKKLYTPDEREENEGKPPQYKGSFETKRDQDFGRDPSGRRENDKMEVPKPSMESVNRLVKKLDIYRKKDKEILKEENISMLDDENLLDEIN